MENKLLKLLKNNSISSEKFFDIIHQKNLINIFVRVCRVCEERAIYLELKQRLRKSIDHEEELNIICLYIKKYNNIQLEKDELEYIYKLINAYFRKKNERKIFSCKEKESLLKKQQYKCSFCGVKIDIKHCEIDHIIPFKYVGDELSNNYQCLCQKCNRKKSSNIDLLLDMICEKNHMLLIK